MSDGHRPVRRAALRSIIVVVLVGWTIGAACLVPSGLLAAIRCGVHGAGPRVDMTIGWYVIGIVLAWVAPFVAGAAWFRNPLWIMLASASITMSAFVVIYMFATPSAFCM